MMSTMQVLFNAETEPVLPGTVKECDTDMLITCVMCVTKMLITFVMCVKKMLIIFDEQVLISKNTVIALYYIKGHNEYMGNCRQGLAAVKRS